jgi:hypothetical protein
MQSTERFVLQAIDPSTGCIVLDVAFEGGDWQELCSQIQLAFSDLNPSATYDLNKSDVDRIKKRFKIDFEPGTFDVTVRAWRPIDGLPYKVHTGRELALMLKGTKPLAVFVEDYPLAPAHEEIIPESLFAPYVVSGRFLKREHITNYSDREASGRERKLRVVCYAQPDQQWRIEAYLLLRKVGFSSGWSPGFERMEGTLLGYEDWQNEAYMEMIYRARSPAH